MPENPAPLHWPPPVLPGMAVAVAAPASPVDPPLLAAGVEILSAAGYRVQVGEEVTQPRPWGREADLARARRLEKAWLAPDVRAVIGARGGYGSGKILPHLDLASLRARPVRLVGFSDLTALLLFVGQKLGLTVFHGPTLSQLPLVSPQAREDLWRWLAAPGPEPRTFSGLTVLHPGTAAGPLWGGNLTTLCHLVGTPFMPSLAGALLFLEDHNEAPYRLDRLLHHLLWAGALHGVAGVVLGAFTGTQAEPGEVLEVLAQALMPLKVPVLAGLPVGHQPDNFTLPLGAAAVLDSRTASLRLIG